MASTLQVYPVVSKNISQNFAKPLRTALQVFLVILVFVSIAAAGTDLVHGTCSRSVCDQACLVAATGTARLNSTHLPEKLALANNLCADCDLPLNATAAERLTRITDSRANSPSVFFPPQSLDPVFAELQNMGSPGIAIAQTREDVLAILNSNSACSAWFAQGDSEPSEMFRSIHYEIAPQAPDTTLKLQISSNTWVYQQPYTATSFENAGRHSTITINPHGSFFQQTAAVRVVPLDGGPAGLEISRLQHLDIYTGASRSARITALLHEFGHILGLLPVDAGFPGAAQLSTQNTQLILRFCRSEIEKQTAARR